MRNKRILLLITFIVIASFLMSIPVSSKDAKQIAKNWYSERSDENNLEDVKIIETFFIRENSQNIFYIFNFREKG